MVAEQHRIGRESRGRIRVEAEKSVLIAAPGPAPATAPGRSPHARRPPRPPQRVSDPHTRQHQIEPRSQRPRFGEVGAGPEGLRETG